MLKQDFEKFVALEVSKKIGLVLLAYTVTFLVFRHYSIYLLMM